MPNNNINEEESILLLLKNKNHFNLLLKKNTDLNFEKNMENNFDALHTNIERNFKKLKKFDIKAFNINKFLIYKYVDYPRKECKNFYNEMYIYFENGNIPERIPSYYEITNGKNAVINEQRANSILANSFIPVEMKHIEQVKKEKRKNFPKLSKKNY